MKKKKVKEGETLIFLMREGIIFDLPNKQFVLLRNRSMLKRKH